MFETQLRRIASTQGVFLRREALALGYDDRDVQREHRSGRWIRVHHGCYTFGDIWAGADEREQHGIQSRAVLRTHADDSALSHISRVLESNIDYWGVDLTKTHITKSRAIGGGAAKHVQPHVGQLELHEVEMVNGVRGTRLPRAIVETAAWETTESGLVVANSALHKGLVTVDELNEAYEPRVDWPGGRRAALVLRLADGRIESVGETRSIFLMWQQGIPMPEPQYKIHDSNGRLFARTDFAWPEYGLLGEFDGKVKYGRLLREGEDPGDAVVREKRREERICALTGWRMIRLYWDDLYHPERTAARITQALRRAA